MLRRTLGRSSPGGSACLALSQAAAAQAGAKPAVVFTGIADPAILAPFARAKFGAADDAAYEPVERVAKATGLLD